METLSTVFYSWQSDLDREKTSSAIRSAIKSALNSLDENDKIQLHLDEATRDEAGSPEIPRTIFKKISKADIFVCDITTVNQNYDGRKTPNPNVLIELGYAIANLGWERIIMLYHNDFGDFSKDSPFDLEKRRITSFSIKDKKDKDRKADLANKLYNGLKIVLEKKPKRPSESRVDIKREKDILVLNNLFSKIDINGINRFVQSLPLILTREGEYYCENYKNIIESNTFHLYDKDLQKLINEFNYLWKWFLYHKPDIEPLTRDHFADFSNSDMALAVKNFTEIKEKFKELLAFIRENYVEVDIDNLSEKAHLNYIQFIGTTHR